MNNGWIKIHRSITEHWLYTEKRVYSRLEAWYDILLQVNYTDATVNIKGKLYHVKRGESLMSLDSWAARWNWEKSKVRRFLNLLQSDNMIVINGDNITTRLTVCNYDSYQDERNADETQTQRKRHSNDIQTTQDKEREEEKERKKNKNNTEIQFPSVDEFVVQGKLYLQEAGITGNFDLKLRAKFSQWAEESWTDARGNKIKNWKSKLRMAISYWADENQSVKQSYQTDGGKWLLIDITDPDAPHKTPYEQKHEAEAAMKSYMAVFSYKKYEIRYDVDYTDNKRGFVC